MSTNDFGNIPNPYQSVAATASETPVTVKPASITVFGILNLVFGILGLCGIAASGAQLYFVTATDQAIPNPVIEVMQTNSVYFGFMAASVILGFIATIALIVAGIGLLNGKPYGRTLSIGYAIYGIIASLAGVVFNAIFIMGPMLEQANAMQQGPEQAGAIGGVIGGAVGGICGMIYPIVLLVFMMRAPVVNYMRARQNA